MLPNVVFGLWIALDLSKWAKVPFGRSRKTIYQMMIGKRQLSNIHKILQVMLVERLNTEP